MFVLLARVLHARYLGTLRATPEGNPYPATPHAVLPESATRYRRVIIVGDVHGCPEELQTLLDRCYYRNGVDLLLSVGDLVNKGPQSIDVLNILQREKARAVRGNHDDAALAAWRAWTAKGLPPTKSKYAWVRELPAGLGDGFLGKLPLSLSLPAYGVTVVHAGLVPGVPVQEQRGEDLLKMRDVVPAPALARMRPPESDSEAEVEGEEGPAWDWESTAGEAQEQAQARASQEGAPHQSDTPAAGPTPRQAHAGDEQQFPLLAALRASERRHPAGRAWASVWRGPDHVFFGHDATRRLQVEPWATGLDGGCVYGGKLYAAILPPLDEARRPMLERAPAPQGAQEFALGNGLPAWLVSVEAAAVHSAPKIKDPSAVA